MEAPQSSNLVLDSMTNDGLKIQKHFDELNELNFDLTKLLLNKINALNKQPVRPKSRSGSIDETPYSPTKCLSELNFYKTKSEFEHIEHVEDDENETGKTDQLKHTNVDQMKGDHNQIVKLSHFKQVKQLKDLLLLKKSLTNNLITNEQFELDSLYSSSSEPNRGWQLDDGAFILQCLNRHNYYRKLHQVSNLNLSKNLINYSRDWAEILARNDRLEKRYANRFGESVFALQLDDESTNLNGAIPVDHWYHKGVNYDYSSQYPNNSTSEFTQLIWKETKYLGVACARSKTNRIFVVVNYSRVGNFPHRMIENVFPIKG